MNIKAGKNTLTKKRLAGIILKECFWGDYSFTENEIINMTQSDNLKQKQFLFSKIIQNSRHTSYLLRIFSEKDLKELFRHYKITFNRKLLEKRINLSKAILLDEYDDEFIEKYRWKY